MERNFTDENFESFLQQNAEGLRMRPSEKVWKGISSSLNRRKRRIGFAIGSVLMAISTLGYFALQPDKPGSSVQDTTVSAQDQNNQPKVNGGAAAATSNTPAPVISMLSSPQADFEQRRNPVLASRNGDENISTGSQETNLANSSPATEQAFIFQPTIIDNDPELTPNSTGDAITEVKQNPLYPQTIESVVNLRPKAVSKRPNLQFYFTPTISYRRLSENKAFLHSQNAPVMTPAATTDVNRMVTHKPDMGFEFGMALRYPLTKNLRLRAGMQFNISRYAIRAYQSSTAVTTIILNTRNNGVDSLNSLTRYSNQGQEDPNWLENFYFQVSAPVGLEMILAGNDKVRFGIAATLQPTYALGGKAYIIDTDYESYTQVPELKRHWNMNTSLETFVEYSTGRLNWQVGPQVRYQLLSSFASEYPVKEHLFNYGLKVGISLNRNR